MASKRIRVCIRCGKRFSGTGEQRLCPECRSAAKVSTVLLERTCRECGTVFLGGPRAWYCPECRNERRKKTEKEYKARQKHGAVRKIGSTAYCSICGKPYTVTGGLQKYCPDCAPAAVAENTRSASRKWAEEHKKESYQRKRELNAARKYLCAYCGKEFTPKSSESWCSKECRRELYRISNAASKYKAGVTSNPPQRQRYASGLPQSDLPGVHFLRRSRRWEVKIAGRYIGCYKNKEEAEKAWSDIKNAEK